MKACTFFLLFLVSFVSSLDAAKVLFLAGEASHGWNEHEFPKGCAVLAEGLEKSGLGIEASVSLGWPAAESEFDGVDAVVIYCDGGAKHLVEGRVDALERIYKAGTGVVFLHYAVEPGSEELAAFMMESIGGYFDLDWSVNPVWELRAAKLGGSEVSFGVDPFEIKDEWYYHMRFRSDGGYEPLLSALPPLDTLGKTGLRSGNAAVRAALEAGELQHLAWRREGEDGQRGFGFTGGHFHHNWNDADFRTLILNGVAWAAGVDVPAGGVVSEFPDIVTYKTIDEAIARGALPDVKVHLRVDPQLLNTEGRGKMTPLQQAVMRKKSEIALFLLGEGADPNALTGSQQTTLHLAVVRNLPELCRALGAAGVDLTLRDKQGWTALHLAAAKNQPEMVRALLEIGCDANALSAAGGTPLHEAAASAGEEVVQMLLDAGVDASVVSQQGVSALDLAREYKNDAAIGLLE